MDFDDIRYIICFLLIFLLWVFKLNKKVKVIKFKTSEILYNKLLDKRNNYKELDKNKVGAIISFIVGIISLVLLSLVLITPLSNKVFWSIILYLIISICAILFTFFNNRYNKDYSKFIKLAIEIYNNSFTYTKTNDTIINEYDNSEFSGHYNNCYADDVITGKFNNYSFKYANIEEKKGHIHKGIKTINIEKIPFFVIEANLNKNIYIKFIKNDSEMTNYLAYGKKYKKDYSKKNYYGETKTPMNDNELELLYDLYTDKEMILDYLNANFLGYIKRLRNELNLRFSFIIKDGELYIFVDTYKLFKSNVLSTRKEINHMIYSLQVLTLIESVSIQIINTFSSN